MRPRRLVPLVASGLILACAPRAQSTPSPAASDPASAELIPLPRAAPMAFLIGATPSPSDTALAAATARLEAWLARDGHRDAVRAEPVKLHLFAYTPHELGGGDDAPVHWHPYRIAAHGSGWAPSIGDERPGQSSATRAQPPRVPLYSADEHAAPPKSPMAFLVEAVPMLRTPAPLDHRDLDKLWLERQQGDVLLRWRVRDGALRQQLAALAPHDALYACEGAALAYVPCTPKVASEVGPDGLAVHLESAQQRAYQLLAARAAGMHNAVTFAQPRPGVAGPQSSIPPQSGGIPAQKHKRHPILDALRKATAGPERAFVCLAELGEHQDLLVRRAAADELSRYKDTVEQWFPGLARAFARETDPQVLTRMLTTLLELGARRTQLKDQVRALCDHKDLGLQRAAAAALAELEK